MEHKIPCSMIQDLMPLHVDGLTSDLSNTEIERHLEECEECKARYSRMKSSIEQNKSRKQSNNERELDYLKKINISQKRNLIIGSIISFILGLSLPILKFTEPIMNTILNGGRMPAYYSARLNLIWSQILFKMIVSGIIVFLLYFIIRILIKKFKSK